MFRQLNFSVCFSATCRTALSPPKRLFCGDQPPRTDFSRIIATMRDDVVKNPAAGPAAFPARAYRSADSCVPVRTALDSPGSQAEIRCRVNHFANRGADVYGSPAKSFTPTSMFRTCKICSTSSRTGRPSLTSNVTRQAMRPRCRRKRRSSTPSRILTRASSPNIGLPTPISLTRVETRY